MMSKEYYLNELKVRLYEEVGYYIQLKKDYEAKKTSVDCLYDLDSLLSDYNIYDIYDNRFQVSALLEYIFDKEAFEQINDKFNEVLYSNFNNSGYPTLPDEEIYRKLLVIRNVIYDEYLKEKREVRKSENEVVKGEYLIKKFKYIHSCLKEGRELKGNSISVIKQFMEEKSYSPQKQILVLEAIKGHNIKAHNHLTEVPRSYIEKMINTYLRKFEIPEEVENQYSKECFPKAISYYKIIHEIDSNEINAYLEYLPKAEKDSDVEMFKYIYLSFMNLIIDDIHESIRDISDLEIYNDSDYVTIAIEDYKNNLKKYITVFNYFKQELSKLHEDIKEYEEKEELDEQENNEYVNRLVYLKSNGVSTLEKDLKDINREYYDRVYSLLERKKLGTLTSRKDRVMKSTNDKLAGFGKLEEDQVRIMYKPLGNNIYLIIGGFVKKATKDLTGYLALANEYNSVELPPIEEMLEEAPALEESLLTYINSNKRRQDR